MSKIIHHKSNSKNIISIIEIQSSESTKNSIKNNNEAPILPMAFTITRGRPYFIRCCLLQMVAQTHPITHCILINHPEADLKTDHNPANYISLLEDIHPQPGTSIWIAFGKKQSLHDLHMSAIQLINLSKFDLFLKIDDDDIYYKNYVNEVVQDYLSQGWDLSGSFSSGIIDKEFWYPKMIIKDLGQSEEERSLKIPSMMPSSYAFSKKAIQYLISQKYNFSGEWHDYYWRKTLTLEGSFKIIQREKSSFSYHVHGNNICQPQFKKKETKSQS